MGKRGIAVGDVWPALALVWGLVGPVPNATAAANWAIDPGRTRIDFVVDAVGFPPTHGEFQKFEGRIAVDFDHPERSRVGFVVDSASAEVGSPAFDAFVRGDALLDASRFPSIEFVSTSVSRTGDHKVRVTGDLTMLGVTRPLDVDVDVQFGNGASRKRLEFSAKATINRLEFGMNSGFPVISRDVELTISSEAYES